MSQPVEVDLDLPSYAVAQGPAGSLKSAGSDTVTNLMTLWLEEFKKQYPGVQTATEGKGSNSAPPALIEGQAQLGGMSREMNPKETDEFEKKFGYKPTALRVAVDTIVIYVHRDNPLNSISLEQVKRVFSKDGGDATWGDLGVKDPKWASKPVSLYGRNSASGTAAYFKDNALGGADFKTSVKEQAGSSTVVQAVGADMFSMGYCGVGYRSADVKALRLSTKTGEEAIEPTADNAYAGDYPLARFLYVYLNHAPGTKLDPTRGEFIRFVFSRQGQEVVLRDGFFPVTADVAREELRKVGLPAAF